MKNIIIGMVVLSALVSCGKKNALVDVNPNGVPAVSPISSINQDSGSQSLASAITNNTFNSQYANYYSEYNYGVLTNTCVTKDGWFGIDYQSCSTNTTNPTKVIHGEVNLDVKKAQLNAILAKTVVFQTYGQLIVLKTTDNFTYQIRLDYPMQANPVYSLNNADSKATRLTSIRY